MPCRDLDMGQDRAAMHQPAFVMPMPRCNIRAIRRVRMSGISDGSYRDPGRGIFLSVLPGWRPPLPPDPKRPPGLSY